MRPLRSTVSHQFCHVWHRVRLAISDGASTDVEPALRVALGLHAFGDGLPVVDFSLVHGEESLKKSPGSHPRGLLYVFSQLRKRRQKARNPFLDLSVRMTDAQPCPCISGCRRSLRAHACWPGKSSRIQGTPVLLWHRTFRTSRTGDLRPVAKQGPICPIGP